jgi:multisubunit Na+/H+ antiporter MnhB subunit
MSEWIQLIIRVINWMNGFVAIIVLLMIIYAWAQILLSAWDEEKIKKWKQALIYIAIGLFVLAINFLILTFFLRPENII